MTDSEVKIKILEQEIDQLEDRIKVLEDYIEEKEEEIYKLENMGEKISFYDIDNETLEDQTKSYLLKENWEYFTAQQLEGFLKMIGRNI